MDYLSYWLMVVAAMRTLSVMLGYTSPRYFQEQLFTTSTSQVTPLASRTFAIWTFLSCALALIAAFHLHERGIYLATTLSFYTAAVYFTLELLVFGTVKLKDRFVVMAFAVASRTSAPHSHHTHTTGAALLGSTASLSPMCCVCVVACCCSHLRDMDDVAVHNVSQKASVACLDTTQQQASGDTLSVLQSIGRTR